MPCKFHHAICGIYLRCILILLILHPYAIHAHKGEKSENEIEIPGPLPTPFLEKEGVKGEAFVAIMVDPLSDQCNTEGNTVNLAVVASGGDGALIYSATNLPPGLLINAASGLISGTVTNTAFTGIAYTVTIDVDDSDLDGSDIASITFDWEIHDTPQVLYRVNCAGPAITAIDGAIDWSKDEKNDASPYLIDKGSNGASTHGGMNSYDPSVDLTTTPTGIFNAERWDRIGGSQIEYEFPLSAGVYELRLYIGNEDPSTSAAGTRVFDISVEGTIPTLLKDIDASSQFGHRVGGVFSYSLIVNDGGMNIKLLNNIGNPILDGIEIITGDSCNLPSAYPITLTPFPNQYNEQGQNINLTVQASGGDGALVYTASGLPDGLTLNSSSGLISGTITAPAAANSPHAVTITVDDTNIADVNTETTSFTWEVFPSGTSVIDAWTFLEPQITDKHTPRHENSFVKAGDKFYLFGGRESPKQVEVYDFINRSWSTASAQAPVDLNHFQPIAYDGYIWVIGAFQTNSFPTESPADSIYIYDPLGDEWVSGIEIPAARRRGSAGAVLYQDKMYIVGGNTVGHDGGYVKWFDVYDPALGTWTALTDAPRERDHFQSVVIGDKMYVAAGRLSGGPGGGQLPLIGEVDVYDFTNGTWSTLPAGSNLPTLRAGNAAVNFKGDLLVIGGEGNGQAWSTVESMDVGTNNWQTLAPLNIARHGTQAVVAGDGIYITSGSPISAAGNMTNMEIYSKENAPAEAPYISGQLLSKNSSIILTPVSVGNSSSTVSKIYNTGGTQGILLTEIELQADPTEYELITNFTLPVVLGVDDTLEFTVKYTPLAVNPISGNVLVTHNGTNATLTLPISGVPILPVEWLSFSVEEQAGDALLSWTTASELNNEYFVVERSLSGGLFEALGQVDSKGNSTTATSYEFRDKDVFDLNSSLIRYRIRQVDYDGLFNFSPQVELNLDVPIGAYPVPFSDELYIHYYSARFETPGIRIMSSMGQLVYEKRNLEGNGNLKVNTENWPRGVYLIQLISGSKDRIIKIMKE